MAFRVEIEPRAIDDLDSIAEYIKKNSSFAVAEAWFNGVMDDIASLTGMPRRCPVAPESLDLGREIRILLHGRRRTYKIYYAVDFETSSDGMLRVFHVRHGSRQPLTEDELQDLLDG